jgi:hypothetical protein
MAILTLLLGGPDTWFVIEDTGWLEALQGIDLRPGSSRSGMIVYGPCAREAAELFIARRNGKEM